jgi:hypothetical protein
MDNRLKPALTREIVHEIALFISDRRSLDRAGDFIQVKLDEQLGLVFDGLVERIADRTEELEAEQPESDTRTRARKAGREIFGLDDTALVSSSETTLTRRGK